MDNGSHVSKKYFERALSYLPPRIAGAIRRRDTAGGGDVSEIRLVASSGVRIVVGGASVDLGDRLSDAELARTLSAVCGNSVYSHSETMREGFVVTSDGIRVGLSGRAVSDGGRITGIADVSGMVIRIPSRRIGAADELYSIMKEDGFSSNTLVWSPPSWGKTTLLRELTSRLSSGSEPLCVAVVDTRYEISEGLHGYHFQSLLGYPRAKGMEIAVRTLSPDVIICDEIATGADLEAVRFASGSGTTVVASCHAEFDDPFKREIMRSARDEGLFTLFYGINKQSGEYAPAAIIKASPV